MTRYSYQNIDDSFRSNFFKNSSHSLHENIIKQNCLFFVCQAKECLSREKMPTKVFIDENDFLSLSRRIGFHREERLSLSN